jgi:hypothetical protein
MFIPDDIKKCVVFLGMDSTKTDPPQVHWGGTGFFVSLASRLSNIQFMYLVTAGHVAKQLKDRTFYIRANSKSGESITFKADDSLPCWAHPEDTAADVAIFPFPSLPKDIIDQIDYRALPTTMFLNESERRKDGIGEGNEIVIVGLFSRHAGNAKNLPLIRMGTVAMFPDERIPTTDYGNMDAYLVEVRSIGGLSGSPVFVVQQERLDRVKLHLLGLIHGHWDVSPEEIIDVSTPDTGTRAGVNMGIAIVTPAKKIMETINRKELETMRERALEKWIADNSPTPDAS